MFKYIVVGIFIILVGTCWYLGSQLKSIQNKLNTTIAQYEQQLKERPREIIVRDTRVEYKYKDGKVITKYIPQEGNVSFDVSKYDALVAREDSLKKVQATLSNKLSVTLKEKLSLAKDKETQINLVKDYQIALAEVDAELAKIQAQLNKPESYIKIKNKGFTLRPEFGGGYGGEWEIYGGTKIGYWNRYGLSIGSTSTKFGVGLSRRIDDVLPIFHNTEIMVFCGYPYISTDSKIFLGIKTGL
jgi:hypothetical protein